MAEDLITRYQLDISDLRLQVKQLEDQFKKLTDAEKKSAKEGEEAFKKTGDAAEETTKQSSALEKKLGDLGKTILAAFAVERIISFGAESVKAFAEAEAGALKLKSAVQVNGGLNEEFTKLLDQSAKLQATTIFSDDAIQSFQTAALQFGLTADEVERLTPIVADFASATGQDLNSALSVIIAGTNGAVRGLRQYGVSLDEGQTKQENYIQIVDQLSAKFKGQAELIGNTTGGSLQKLANAWDDLKETVGGALAPLVVGISDLTKGFVQLVNSGEKESQTLQKQRDEFNNTAMAAMSLTIGTKERTTAIQALQAQYPNLLGNLNAEKVSNEDLRKALNQVNEQYVLKIAIKKGEEEITPILDSQAEALNKVVEAEKVLRNELRLRLEQSEDSREGIKQSNLDNIAFLKEIPVAAAADELLKNRIQLAGVSSASLVELSKKQQEYKDAQLEYTAATIEADKAQSEFNDKVKSLKNTFGIVDEAITGSAQSTVNYKTLTLKALEELAAKNDSLAQAEIDRREELNKKALEKQKEAFKELEKIANESNKKQLEDTAKNEVEKLKVQKDAALKQAALLFEQAGGEKNKNAVKVFNQAVLAIETDYAQLIKNAKLKATSEYYAEQLKLSEQNSAEDLQNTLTIIDTNAAQQINVLKEKFLEKADFSKKAEEKLQDEITKIQLDAERKRAEESFKFKEQQIENERILAIRNAIQETQQRTGLVGLELLTNKQFQQSIVNANADANNKKAQNDKQYANTKEQLNQKTTDSNIAASKQEVELAEATREEKIQAAQQATGELLALLNTLTQNQITAKEQELTRLQEGYDAEDAELQRRYELRLIGAAEFEIQQDRIKQERLKSEKKLNDEIIKLKKQQDIANRAQAVFDIIINTAVAVTNALKTSAFLAVAIGIAGAAQLTAVLATPLPKYAKGTKYLQRGNNPAGVDTIPILANEGERIIPTDKNKKYWSIYEAIDGNKFDEFISRKYVAPALQRQLNDYKKSESLSFAENISNSLIFNHDLLASKIGSEIEWRNRNGIKVKGMQDLIDALTTTTDLRKR